MGKLPNAANTPIIPVTQADVDQIISDMNLTPKEIERMENDSILRRGRKALETAKRNLDDTLAGKRKLDVDALREKIERYERQINERYFSLAKRAVKERYLASRVKKRGRRGPPEIVIPDGGVAISDLERDSENMTGG